MAWAVRRYPRHRQSPARVARAGSYRLSSVAMIDQLRVSGFRALRNVSIDFAPGKPVVLIGENATGKSTILDAVALLAAFASGRGGEAIMDRGGWDAVRWAGTANELELSVRFRPEGVFAKDAALVEGESAHCCDWCSRRVCWGRSAGARQGRASSQAVSACPNEVPEADFASIYRDPQACIDKVVRATTKDGKPGYKKGRDDEDLLSALLASPDQLDRVLHRCPDLRRIAELLSSLG
jgi:energy-coupling factor transporter ATP-binding protein EcfA2